MDEKLKKTSFSALNISKQWAYLFAASMLTLAPLSASASESNDLNASKSLAVQQDKKTVSGTVVDANGEPIIGATVKEVGTQNDHYRRQRYLQAQREAGRNAHGVKRRFQGADRKGQ